MIMEARAGKEGRIDFFGAGKWRRTERGSTVHIRSNRLSGAAQSCKNVAPLRHPLVRVSKGTGARRQVRRRHCGEKRHARLADHERTASISINSAVAEAVRFCASPPSAAQQRQREHAPASLGGVGVSAQARTARIGMDVSAGTSPLRAPPGTPRGGQGSPAAPGRLPRARESTGTGTLSGSLSPRARPPRSRGRPRSTRSRLRGRMP